MADGHFSWTFYQNNSAKSPSASSVLLLGRETIYIGTTVNSYYRNMLIQNLVLSVFVANVFSSHRFTIGSPIAVDTMPLCDHAPFSQMANPLHQSQLHGPFAIVDAGQNVRAKGQI